MFQFTTKQKKTFQTIAHTRYGKELTDIFSSIQDKITDVTDIQDNYETQVEARKLVKDFILSIKEYLSIKSKSSSADEFDDME